MPLVFSLRRAFDCGIPVGAAKVFITARGALQVAEARDDRFKRVVRTAEFIRVDGGEPIPRRGSKLGATFLMVGARQRGRGQARGSVALGVAGWRY